MILFCFLLGLFTGALSSAGDKSKYYQNCFFDCEKRLCTPEASKTAGYFIPLQWFELTPLSPWTCREICDDDCQWDTVKAFQERGWRVPQFFGKWPFVRLLGLQEPAAAIFSLANLAVVLRYLWKINKEVSSDSPYYRLWKSYAIISINCWVWSYTYHTRDTDITERLDYISASILVFASFFCMTVRTLSLRITRNAIIWSVACGLVLLNHCAYLWYFPFDYAYNMMFNVFVGGLAVTGWLVWSAVATKLSHPCPMRVAAYCVLMTGATFLELMDFPPILWSFDAHALWHLATCFIVPLFYSFVIRDCQYLSSFKLPVKVE